MGVDEEKEEVETLKKRVVAMRAAHHTGSAQSPTSLHSRCAISVNFAAY